MNSANVSSRFDMHAFEGLGPCVWYIILISSTIMPCSDVNIRPCSFLKVR